MLRLEYDNAETAAAIAKAVSPDNYQAPEGLTVKTELQEKAVITEISLDGRIGTLIATIDDLLESVSTAERALHIVKTAK